MSIPVIAFVYHEGEAGLAVDRLAISLCPSECQKGTGFLLGTAKTCTVSSISFTDAALGSELEVPT